MPDGRFLSKTIATDLELNTASMEADYLFARCVPHLDREGRLQGHPMQVKGTAVPMRREMTEEVVDRALGELATAGLVIWYIADGRPCLEFPGFATHQKGLRKDREAESRIPGPQSTGAQRITSVLHPPAPNPDGGIEAPRPQPQVAQEDTESLRTNSGLTPDLLPHKLSEVKRSEVKNNGPSADVEKSSEEGEPKPTAELPTYTESHLLEEANTVLGLSVLDRDAQGANRSILKHWLYKRPPIPSEEVYAAIHGLRWMVDNNRPEVSEWLSTKKPISLKALNNTETLFDQGDGKAKRVLFDVAVELYQRAGDREPGARGKGVSTIAQTMARMGAA